MEDIKPINFNQTVNHNEAPKLANSTKPNKKIMILMGGLILLGVVTGYGIFYLKRPKMPQKLSTATEGNVTTGKTYGVQDKKRFRMKQPGNWPSAGLTEKVHTI